MKDDNTRNMILAFALSLLVLLGWQFLVVNPRVEQERLKQAAEQVAAPRGTTSPQTNTAAPGAPPVPTSPGAAPAPVNPSPTGVLTREAALAAGPRVAINTARLQGSLSLKGGRIDDLKLTGYRETVDPGSPLITLFSPSGTAAAFYAETGVVGAAGSGMPGADTLWRQEGSGALSPSTPVTLVYDNGKGQQFRRTYAVDDAYMFTINEEVRNTGSDTLTLYPYGLVSRHGTPKVAGFYILHEGLIGVLGQAGLKEYTYADIKKASQYTEKATGGWVGITDKYWAATIIPEQAEAVQGRFNASGAGAGEIYQADVLGSARTLAPASTITFSHRVFAGAKEVTVVDNYRTTLGIDRFDLLIDWGWFYFLTKPLFWIIDYFFHVFGNFGWSIILVTVLIKAVFYPLANKSYESMSRMKKIQPEMVALRERYPDDKMKQQQEMMELYKREKINPLSGCLPVLIQIPVFFALYKVIFVSIEMRHAPFIGWIKDLSAPDPTNLFTLFGLIPVQMPEFLQMGAWPIIMGVTMFIQMKMNPDPPDPVQKTMFAWMPVIFTFMLASFPAGLVIYWAWNNLLSVTQQYMMMRKQGVKVELWDNIASMFGKSAEKKS